MGALKSIYMADGSENRNEARQDTDSMMEEYEQKRRKQVATMRSILDYGIGTAIVVAGFFLFFRHRFDLDFNKRFPPNEVDMIMGGICVLYGAWRIYRGYKKNYFR